MNKAEIKISKEEFKIIINGAEMKYVQEYNINSNSKDKGIVELTLKIPIDSKMSSIDINNQT